MYDGSRTVAEADGNENTKSREDADSIASLGSNLSVAEQLRRAREARGLSIADVAGLTRITSRHVEAIEQGDYATLPGRPYALGFARSYARAVGLDGAVIAEAVRAELGARAPAPEPRVIHQFEVGDPDKTPSRLVSWLALLLVIAIVGMGLVFWRSYYSPSAELPALVGAPAPQAPVAKPPAPATPASAPAANGAVVFTALEEGIWVKFYDGSGKQLMQKQMAKGESYTVPADAVGPMVWTGRPEALAVSIGGHPIGKLDDSRKTVRDLPVSAAALLARSSASTPQSAPASGSATGQANRAAMPTTAPSGGSNLPKPQNPTAQAGGTAQAHRAHRHVASQPSGTPSGGPQAAGTEKASTVSE